MAKNLSKVKTNVLIGVLVTLNTLLLGNEIKVSPANQMTVNVIDVIDGDTLVTDNKMRIRLFRVNAPELDMCMGVESRDELSRLTKNKTVLLKEIGADKFGRLLAKVYVNDLFVNEEMLKKGLARYDGSGGQEMKDAFNLAKTNKIGIYEKCVFYENKENHMCSIKGNIDKDSGAKIYHFDGCSGYKGVAVEYDLGESWFCSEKEAVKAGYVKSKQCFGKKY